MTVDVWHFMTVMTDMLPVQYLKEDIQQQANRFSTTATVVGKHCQLTSFAFDIPPLPDHMARKPLVTLESKIWALPSMINRRQCFNFPLLCSSLSTDWPQIILGSLLLNKMKLIEICSPDLYFETEALLLHFHFQVNSKSLTVENLRRRSLVVLIWITDRARDASHQ